MLQRIQACRGARRAVIGVSFALFTVLALQGSAASVARATPVPAPMPSDGQNAQGPADPMTNGTGAAAQNGDLDTATREALALEQTIGQAEEDALALQERIDAVNEQIMSQRSTIAQSESDLAEAERKLNERLVRLYKSGAANPVLVLVSARSLADLFTSASLLSRILSEDTAAYRMARQATMEAAYQSGRLEELKAELVRLRSLHRDRLAVLQSALSRQRSLVASLSAASRALVARRQTERKKSRAEWQASSIPLGTAIEFVPATVRPYTDRTYLVAAHQPKRYRSTGQRFTAVCSWYGGIFNGRRTASGQVYNMQDLTCASRTLPFGTRLAVSREGRRVIVVVTDRGPFIDGRDLDLSYAAARALGFSGVARVDAEFVEPEKP